MHPNPVYRQTPSETSLAYARERGFGTLAVNGESGPLLSHVPFLLNDGGSAADLHLVRSNPIARLGRVPAVIAVSGPDGYVSPDWYGMPDQVPTWNYIAVHLRGILEPLPPDTLRSLLDRQSEEYEARLLPKPAWRTGKMDPAALDRLMRMILPFRFAIETVDATWKLSQNKPGAARLGAADGVGAAGFGQETDRLARMMREAGEG